MLLSVVLALYGCHRDEPVASGVAWLGEQPQDEAGRALDVGSVLDGALPSLLVGTPSELHDPEANSGGVYLLDGNAPGGVLDDTALASFAGSGVNDFGRAVAITADLTGDGRPDVVVTGGDAWVVPDSYLRVYAGPFSGPIPVETAWMTMTYNFRTESPAWVSRCGDLNGDIIDDLCVGATGGVSGNTSKVAVFYGPVSAGILDFGDASVQVTTAAAECAGQHLKGDSDLDGDGAAELVVGNDCRNGGEGGLYVVSSLGTWDAFLEDFPTWTGEPGTGQAGIGLAVGGDLDDDGLSDLFVGAPKWDDGAGRAYVVVDKGGGSLTNAYASIDSEDEQSWVGFDGAIGDFDGDGTADLAVGAPRDIYFGLDRPGHVAIFLGPMGRGQSSFEDAALEIAGSEEPDAFGMTLAAADVNGDGSDDLAVGAPFDDRQAEDAGAVYLFSGRSLFP